MGETFGWVFCMYQLVSVTQLQKWDIVEERIATDFGDIRQNPGIRLNGIEGVELDYPR